MYGIFGVALIIEADEPVFARLASAGVLRDVDVADLSELRKNVTKSVLVELVSEVVDFDRSQIFTRHLEIFFCYWTATLVFPQVVTATGAYFYWISAKLVLERTDYC